MTGTQSQADGDSIADEAQVIEAAVSTVRNEDNVEIIEYEIRNIESMNAYTRVDIEMCLRVVGDECYIHTQNEGDVKVRVEDTGNGNELAAITISGQLEKL